MPESPPDKPLMTIAPDGYIPRRMQLHRVRKTSDNLDKNKPQGDPTQDALEQFSINHPEDVDNPTPTKASKNFLSRNKTHILFAGSGSLFAGMVIIGFQSGESRLLIAGAIGYGLTIAASGASAIKEQIGNIRK